MSGNFGKWIPIGLIHLFLLAGNVHGWQTTCPLIIRTEAVLGEPFGVGMVSFRLPAEAYGTIDPNMIIRTGAIRITEAGGRILYPAEGQPAAARFFRGIFGAAEKPTDEILSIWFLFRGNQPLQLTIWGCEGGVVQVEPKSVRPQKFQRHFNSWWKQFQASNRQQSDLGDFPELISTYLNEMMAYRLNLDRPRAQEPSVDPLRQTIALLTDIDPLRADMIREWFSGELRYEPDDTELPPSIPWGPVIEVRPRDDVAIEPIAWHVPNDCFYLRFGTWDNQLWLKRLIEEHGGDLGRMVRLRGFRGKVQSKFLNQLALESSQLDEWFGGNLIADVAVIGRDTYFETGASVGVLLYSKDAEALNGRISQRRKKFVTEAGRQSGLTQVEIAGQPVSLLSSADNRYRSFYATKGNAHLFTTSRTIMEAFLTCGEQGKSLADSPDFRFARQQQPLSNDDTVFVFFPALFFQRLLEPQYQIELYRRGKSITEMQLIQLARLSAGHEGFPNAPMEFLIGNGFLPATFAERPEGSQIDVVDGEWVDRQRGRRGFYTPIADTRIDRVSLSEYAWFVKRAQFFQQSVQQLDPMFLALKRFQRDDKVERIVFDARIAPFGQEKYGWLTSMLGPPLEFEVVGNPDDLVRLQMSLQGGGWQRNVPQHQLFAAIQGDVNPNIDLRPASFFDAWKTLKQVPGYLGGWPAPGTLDWMPRLGGQPDANGYTYSRLLDLWRLQFGEFSVLAFDPSRLEALRQSLQVVATERAAQVRLQVGDLSQSDLDGWANVLNYRRAWEASIANCQLLNMVVDQFGVPAERSREVTEQLLNVELVCSLGGNYELLAIPGRSIWVSDAWPDFGNPQIPAGYQAPVLNWFRGLELEVTQVSNQFSVHGFLDIERSQSTPGMLPSFDLFKGFQNLFPGESKGGEAEGPIPDPEKAGSGGRGRR